MKFENILQHTAQLSMAILSCSMQGKTVKVDIPGVVRYAQLCCQRALGPHHPETSVPGSSREVCAGHQSGPVWLA